MNLANQTVTNLFTNLSEDDYDFSSKNNFRFRIKPNMNYLFSPGQYVTLLKKEADEYSSLSAFWSLNTAETQRSAQGSLVNTPTMVNMYRWPSTAASLVHAFWQAGDGTEFQVANSEQTVTYPENNDIATWGIYLTPLGKLQDIWANIQLPNWRSTLNYLASMSPITWSQTNLAFLSHIIARPS